MTLSDENTQLARVLYPEHAKLAAVKDHSQAIGEFIEFCGYTLCEYDEGEPQWRPVQRSIERLLADYFDIDLDVIEAEKRAMLEALRAAQ